MSKLHSPQVAELLQKIEEASRSTDEGVKRFIEPASGALGRCKSKRHHIIFGRRGSGKSSLLRKAAADLTLERRPISSIDLEAFKGHAYPDVLLSVLIRTFEGFIECLQTAAIYPASKTSFWKKIFGTGPSRASLDKQKAEELIGRMRKQVNDLRALLHESDNITVTRAENVSTVSEGAAGVNANVKAHMGSVGVSKVETNKSSSGIEIEQAYVTSKIEALHRRIIDYQEIFKEISTLSGQDCFLFLDDLYHIKRSSQAEVLDYFHRIAKGTGLWLKVGTIRNRSRWYSHGDPPLGIKLGDDADDIDLDLSLEKFLLAKSFLEKVIAGFLGDYGLKVSDLMTDGALDRLVLASGGVARDFLGLFRRSISVAQERSLSTKGTANKVDAEDVNNAAGEYETTKREELTRDTIDEKTQLEEEFDKVREFCSERTKTNIFLIKKDSSATEATLIYELVDLRLIHKIRSRVTVRDKPGKIFEGFMLDISQYTGSRKRRGFNMLEFWREDEDALRRGSLVFIE